jgi:hypothetical protein
MYGKMNWELGRYPEAPVVKIGRPDNRKRGRPMVVIKYFIFRILKKDMDYFNI